MVFRYIAIVFTVFAIGACGSSDTADVPDPEEELRSYSCAPYHTPPDGMTEAATYENCDWKTQQSIDVSVFAGLDNLYNGEFTVDITGIGDITHSDPAFFLLMEGTGNDGKFINIHAFWKKSGFMRLVHHFWSTGGWGGLQMPNSQTTYPMNNTSVIHTWNCSWNTETFSCSISSSDGSSGGPMTVNWGGVDTTDAQGNVAKNGAFYSFRSSSFLFGDAVNRSTKMGSNVLASNLRVTVFQ